MGAAPRPWLVIDIAPIAGLTTSPGNAVPGIVNTEHIGRVATIDKHIIVFNTLLTGFTTTIKIINPFPTLGFMPSKNAIM